jgi:hypothetical protein
MRVPIAATRDVASMDVARPGGGRRGDAEVLAYDCGMVVKRDIAVEAQRDLAARRAAVAENRARGVSENLRDALKLVRTGEQLHASVRRG